MKKMNMGGMAMVKKGDKMVPSFAADGKGKMAKGGMPPALAKHAAKPASKAHAGLKAGGVTRADGIATKGKTKGKMISMMSGGKTC